MLQAELTALLSGAGPTAVSGPAGISGGAALPRRAPSAAEVAMLRPDGAVSALLTAGLLTRGLQQDSASLWFSFPRGVSQSSLSVRRPRRVLPMLLSAFRVSPASELEDSRPFVHSPAHIQGQLANAILAGRQVLTAALRKQPLKQLRQRDAEKLKVRGSPFPAVFHIRDAVGGHLISSVATTTGPLLRLPEGDAAPAGRGGRGASRGSRRR